MTKHCEFGGSGAKRWLTCPASITMSRGIKRESSPYAEEGTKAHALGEWCLKHGKQIAEAPKAMRMDEESEAAVQIYLDKARPSFGDRHWIEASVDLLPMLSEPLVDQLFGTVDFASVKGNHLLIADYKHGKGVPVPPEGNDQMLFYAAGMMALLREKEPGRAIRKITLAVIQPRCSDVDPVQSVEIVPETIYRWIKMRLEPGIRAALLSAPTFAPSEDNCRFCPAHGKCRAAEAQAVDEMFAPVVHEGAQPPAPDSLTTEQIGRILAAREVLDGWLDAVAGYALGQAKEGVAIPGMKLVQKRANRVWKEGAEAELVKVFGGREAYTRKIISPAQAEKLAKSTGTGKALVEAWQDKPVGDLTLVPESDKREAVSATPYALMFGADLLA